MPAIGGYKIRVFDKDLNFIQEYDYKVKNKLVRDVILKDDKIVFIEHQYNSKENSFAYMASESSFLSFDFKESELFKYSIDEMRRFFDLQPKTVLFGKTSQFINKKIGNVIFSPDENHFLINLEIFDDKNVSNKFVV